MAKNQSRSMNAEFAQGGVDNTYQQLTPNRAVVENPPIERMSWPTMRQVEQHVEHPMVEAHIRRADLPREVMTTGDGDTRF
jgi:hypothetical protein